MKHILITGGAGYIGKHLSTYLINHGYYVDVIDRKPDDGELSLLNRYIHQDILDHNQIRAEYDTVIHLAALVQVGGSRLAAMDYYRTNVVGTMNMLERIDYDNFIFASTCQVYGPHVYGHSKHIAEGIIRQYTTLNDKKHTIFRFGNVVGRDYDFNPTNMDGLMYNLMKAKETGTFNLYGDDYDTNDGTPERDYLHVMEVCQAIQKSIERPSCVPGAEIQPIFEYLGHGKLYSVNECINAFKQINNCDFDVVIKPRRVGDVPSVLTKDVSAYMPQNIYTLERMMQL
jgi:UDP-glucose 4-epimerase